MFPSNEYVSDDASENDDEDFSETCDCIYRQCRSSDASTSDSKHCHFCCLVLVRDPYFFTSVFILYLCKKNVYKEVEIRDLFCSVVQNNLCSFCSFTEGKIHWISLHQAPD